MATQALRTPCSGWHVQVADLVARSAAFGQVRSSVRRRRPMRSARRNETQGLRIGARKASGAPYRSLGHSGALRAPSFCRALRIVFRWRPRERGPAFLGRRHTKGGAERARCGRHGRKFRGAIGLMLLA